MRVSTATPAVREVVRPVGREELAGADFGGQPVLLGRERADELAAVNTQAVRISDEMQGGWSRAVVAKQLAEKVQRGQDVTKAVLETLDEQKAVPGAIVPIVDLADVPVGEVTVESEITELFDPK